MDTEADRDGTKTCLEELKVVAMLPPGPARRRLAQGIASVYGGLTLALVALRLLGMDKPE